MKHFKELEELVVGILNAMIKLTMVAGKTLGPQLGTLLVVVALLSALVFACFSAKMLEDFALHALQEILNTLLSAAFVWTMSDCLWRIRKRCGGMSPLLCEL